jgi:hypothetical protein
MTLECGKFDLAKVKDINDMLKCIKDGSLQGSDSTTMSASDIYRFLFTDDTKYLNIPLEAGFMKVYISDGNLNSIGIDKKLLLALPYEKRIYDIIKNEIILKRENPHFIKYLGGKENISFDEMINFLHSKSGISVDELKDNFTRNINYMLYGYEGRSSITKNTPWSVSVPKDPKDYKYGFMLMENLEIPDKSLSKLEDLKIGQSLQLNSFLNLYKGNDLIIIKIYFQIATALYSLYKNGIVHNDLHTGNVFVRKIKPKVFVYNIDGKKYTIESEYEALIFDFDRGYLKANNNPYLDNYLKEYGQINELSDKRDILKVYQYYYQYYTDIAQKIFDDIFKVDSKELKNNLKKLKNDRYNYFNNKYNQIVRPLSEIINNLYNRINEEEINYLKNFCQDMNQYNYNILPNYIQNKLQDEATNAFSKGIINNEITNVFSM